MIALGEKGKLMQLDTKYNSVENLRWKTICDALTMRIASDKIIQLSPDAEITQLLDLLKEQIDECQSSGFKE